MLNRSRKNRGSRTIQVDPYERNDGTPVSGYTRTISGDKSDILGEERELNRSSKDLIRDTKNDNYYKSEYDLYEIDHKAKGIQPMVRQAQSNQLRKKEVLRAKNQAKIKKEMRKAARKEVKARRKQVRETKRQERAERKNEKLHRKLGE